MTQPAKILLVDDEAAIRLTLEAILTREGHQVVTAATGQAALNLITTQNFDLALLDLNLGDINGIEVLAALKQHAPDTVAIMLTAHASLETAVTALRQGAHDYLFKPCQTVDLRESIRQGLLKRRLALQQRKLLHQLGLYFTSNLEEIQSIMAEQFGRTPPPIEAEIKEINPSASTETQEGRFQQYGGLIVDFLRHVITLDGHLLELSPTEFSLLAYLISQSPRVIPPQELLREAQGYHSTPLEASEIIRAHVYHIRQKIKKSGARVNIIRAIRGVGYTINP